MSPSEPIPALAVLSRDCDQTAERLQIALLRRMSPGTRLRTAAAASSSSLSLCWTGIRLRHPLADERTRFLSFASIKLGGDIVSRVYEAPRVAHPEVNTAMDLIDVALRVARVLDRCELRYVVGGSLASSVSGEPRSTLDVDFMVEITERNVPDLIAGLGADFHAEPDSFARAIRNHSSVNIIHLPTATKVDLFVMGATPIEPEQMDRRIKIEVPGRAEAELYVYTPEDILLQKLRWYRLGQEISDRQWRDVLGIITVQGDALDLAYVRRAASELGLSDVLSCALAEAPRSGE